MEFPVDSPKWDEPCCLCGKVRRECRLEAFPEEYKELRQEDR